MFSGIKAPFIPYQVIRDEIDPNNEKSKTIDSGRGVNSQVYQVSVPDLNKGEIKKYAC